MSVSESIIKNLPFFDFLTPDEIERIKQCAYIRKAEKGSQIYSPDQECLGLVAVISGEIRTVMLSPEGREIVLYRLHQNDIDVLSASCVVNQITFETQMVCDADCEMLVIPAVCLSTFKETNIHVRCFIYEKLGERFSDAMHRMEDMLFTRVDNRIAQSLVQKMNLSGSPVIAVTHEQLASLINSSREVVSRELKNMEKQGLLQLGRGKITILEPQKIKTI